MGLSYQEASRTSRMRFTPNSIQSTYDADEKLDTEELYVSSGSEDEDFKPYVEKPKFFKKEKKASSPFK